LRSKVALQDLGAGKFYLLSAIVSLLTYAPNLALRPPARSELLPALGLAFLMAVTFGVTTEAIRRGPLGTVSPITALSPALTAVLAILVLHEHIGLPAYLGVALAPAGIVLLSLGRQEGKGSNWLAAAGRRLTRSSGCRRLRRQACRCPRAGPSALLSHEVAAIVAEQFFKRGVRDVRRRVRDHPQPAK
jgi:multidrug transporter EmrE-like cation transporter